MFKNVVSVYNEIIAYETLWVNMKGSIKELTNLFKSSKQMPSELINIVADKDELKYHIDEAINKAKPFSANVQGAIQFPHSLKDANNAFPVLYHRGDLELLNIPSISVIGSSDVSELGRKRTRKLVGGLVEAGYSIVSGLAKGVDTEAMQTAIDSKGVTIGVIGTPINEFYPKENKELQYKVMSDYLLLSHVPIYYYSIMPVKDKCHFFTQRNEIMAAISQATVIVEASETSGLLIQAIECLRQGRKLFILNSCFEDNNITWPKRFLEKGAIRVNKIEDIIDELQLEKV